MGWSLSRVSAQHKTFMSDKQQSWGAVSPARRATEALHGYYGIVSMMLIVFLVAGSGTYKTWKSANAWWGLLGAVLIPLLLVSCAFPSSAESTAGVRWVRRFWIKSGLWIGVYSVISTIWVLGDEMTARKFVVWSLPETPDARPVLWAISWTLATFSWVIGSGLVRRLTWAFGVVGTVFGGVLWGGLMGMGLLRGSVVLAPFVSVGVRPGSHGWIHAWILYGLIHGVGIIGYVRIDGRGPRWALQRTLVEALATGMVLVALTRYAEIGVPLVEMASARITEVAMNF